MIKPRANVTNKTWLPVSSKSTEEASKRSKIFVVGFLAAFAFLAESDLGSFCSFICPRGNLLVVVERKTTDYESCVYYLYKEIQIRAELDLSKNKCG